jgi:TonB family protein
MMGRLKSAKWVLGGILLACGATVLTPGILAQDASSITSKRKIKTKVLPEYPEVARQLHLQGKVKVEVIISPDGRVTNTKVVGGHPVLAQAAVDAVKKWRFEPGPKDTTEIIEMDFSGE